MDAGCIRAQRSTRTRGLERSEGRGDAETGRDVFELEVCALPRGARGALSGREPLFDDSGGG